MLTTRIFSPGIQIQSERMWLLTWSPSTASYPVLWARPGIRCGGSHITRYRDLGSQQNEDLMRVAAVDIGTNSTRLLVADTEGDGLSTIVRTTTITRLGEGVSSERIIKLEAMERTCALLCEYSRTIRSLGADRVGAIATSACRDASNHEEFFVKVEDSLGVRPTLLSGQAEAMLSFAGAIGAWPDAGPGPILVVDIGGGSTELALGLQESKSGPNSILSYSDDEPLVFPGISLMGWASLDIGCVRLTERFLHSNPPRAEELSEALREVNCCLVSAEREFPARSARSFVGLAGTVTSLAAMDLGLESYDPDAVHHHRLGRRQVEELFRYLATTPKEELRNEPGLEPKRADVIVGGTVVLVAILRRWEFEEVIVSEADILDGAALAISLGLLGSDAA
ncbi:MAG: exopolyphosphatase [Acidimicrobiia bacterium]